MYTFLFLFFVALKWPYDAEPLFKAYKNKNLTRDPQMYT
jgi:hypothetical protein